MSDKSSVSSSLLEPAAVSGTTDAIDPLVVNPGRLSILMALAGSEGETAGVLGFVDLRRRTRLSDGNLSCHAQRLAAGGLIGISKQFQDGKPSTTYLLTNAGRSALQSHVQSLLMAIAPKATVRPAARTPAPVKSPTPPPELLDDDWVD